MLLLSFCCVAHFNCRACIGYPIPTKRLQKSLCGVIGGNAERANFVRMIHFGILSAKGPHLQNHALHIVLKLALVLLLSFSDAAAQPLLPGASSIANADSIFSLARKQFRKARFDSASYWLRRGLPFATESGQQEMIARYRIEEGNLSFMQGRFAEGNAVLTQAAVHLKNVDSYDLQNSYYLIQGNCYSGRQMYDSALFYFRQCEQYNQQKYPYRNWLVYVQLGEIFSKSSNIKEAEQYFQKAYALTSQQPGKPDHGYVLTQYANYCLEHNLHEQFGKLLKEYEDLVKSRKKDPALSANHNLLFLQWKDNSIDNKVKFMQQVKEESLRSKFYNQALLANAYIIGFYEKNKDLETALTYAIESESIATTGNQMTNLYIAVSKKHQLLKQLGRYEEAMLALEKLQQLKDSILLLQRNDVVLDLETKYQTQQKEQAIALLHTQQTLNELQLLKAQELSEGLTRENTLKQEKLEQELMLRMALQRENIFKDSSLLQQQLLAQANESMNAQRMQTLQKEKQFLQRENNLNASLFSAEKKSKRLLIIGLILLGISGIVIYGQYRKQLGKNAIISKQAQEMEVLNREIHHRVKNNLQVISSLLDIQSQTLQDADAAAALKESKQRVQSMAVIHQNLYQGQSIQEIELQTYIQNLAQHLFSSYNTQQSAIQFHTDIEPLQLHTDTVIPIGMILNELISNALKYAFTDLEAGEIKVTMKKQDAHLLLQVQDNGRGLPKDFDIANLHSFGFKVIRSFAQKLRAELLIDGKHGTNVQLLISKFKMA